MWPPETVGTGLDYLESPFQSLTSVPASRSEIYSGNEEI